jgi:hypothetical protein
VTALCDHGNELRALGADDFITAIDFDILEMVTRA